MAGVHCYCDAGDPVLADAGLVAVNAPSGGERVIALRNGKRVSCVLPPPFTKAVFDAETGERVL